MLTQRREDVLALLDAQRHRRFIKTHTPLDGLPADERVTYVRVGRDPRDVAVSWYHHFQNLDEDTFMRARAQAVGLDDVEALAALDPSSGARRLRSSSGTGSTARPRRCIPPPRCARRCTTTRKPYAPPIAPTSWCATTAICRRIWRARCAVWRTVWGSRSRSGYGRRWWRRRRSSGCGPAPTISLRTCRSGTGGRRSSSSTAAQPGAGGRSAMKLRCAATRLAWPSLPHPPSPTGLITAGAERVRHPDLWSAESGSQLVAGGPFSGPFDATGTIVR